MSPRRTQTLALTLALAFACLPACSDDGEGRGSVQNPIGADGGGPIDRDEDGGDDSYPAFNGCDGRRDGTACGPSHHCIEETCLPNRCGDGIKTDSEECDDGNEALGDECTPACRAVSKTCGDGEINDGAEECDDGNTVNDDACANSCTINECGNERLDVGEECDDGNDANDDFCSSDCLRIRCRNGRVEPGEECDDGNSVNNDGCTNACVAVQCGDGVVAEGLEECDDGNTNERDDCSSACQRIACGNNRIDGDEVCDGNDLPEGRSGSCLPDCSDVISLVDCEPCRRRDNQCTDYMGSGINLVDSCLSTPPEGASADWVAKCSALSECITQSQCDTVRDGLDVSTVRTCFCGAGVGIPDCQNEVVPLAGPCVDEYLEATGCASEAKPIPCVLNLGSDSTLPAGYAAILAECDRTFCSAECRPQQ